MPTERLPLDLEVGAWMTDPNLSMCRPATRGIWIDLICAMHMLDRCGSVSGMPDELARLARCSVQDVRVAVSDLRAHDVADISESNGIINRRMRRAFRDRKSNQERQRRHRGSGVAPPSRDPSRSDGEDGNGYVTSDSPVPPLSPGDGLPLGNCDNNQSFGVRGESEGGRRNGGVTGRKPRRPVQTDEEFIVSLIADETYKLIDVRREYGKMLSWCAVNNRQPTQRTFVNWLNRIDRPLVAGGGNGQRIVGEAAPVAGKYSGIGSR